ncbi:MULTISPECIES: hypothetical protein [Dehalobacter]|jgi:hypothetical protein|uniref:Uncharacterized protein n=1 Tax=Dehalobacter restrictus (strain DSM 9455 / PER-K23) TaxID=871738 RepID=A0ABM5PAT4_DEHRP|nr:MULTISPECIES: hypothetical protein [Dehalobacter]AHF11434.1 hypothetical protein DEHRE_10725 [Dehalobacter restrictus DSM 9455]MDJ0304868.1 hypothetical protein [Dehalobacter sp.]
MKRLVLGMTVIIVIALGALANYADSRGAEAEELRQKLLVLERQAEEEVVIPAASLLRIDSDSKERLPRSYEILTDK